MIIFISFPINPDCLLFYRITIDCIRKLMKSYMFLEKDSFPVLPEKESPVIFTYSASSAVSVVSAFSFCCVICIVCVSLLSASSASSVSASSASELSSKRNYCTIIFSLIKSLISSDFSTSTSACYHLIQRMLLHLQLLLQILLQAPESQHCKDFQRYRLPLPLNLHRLLM